MKTRNLMGLSGAITGMMLFTASWLAPAQTPLEPSASKICGDTPHQSLTNAAGQGPQWSFHRYLIDREGRLLDAKVRLF